MMLNKRQYIQAIGLLLIGLMSGCLTKTSLPTNSVSIAPETFVLLPSPSELGYQLTASQLISVSWEDEQHQLPVQLEVDVERIALAGFSSWGSRILSLVYENEQIERSVLTVLDTRLPPPEQVLFNLMITLWPVEAWKASLDGIGWRLVETEKHRQLIDDTGHVVADITYETSDFLAGDIVFTNHDLGCTITIQTLNYQHEIPE